MPICRFWERGNCKNGNNCRFEHPDARNETSQNSNRYAALQAPTRGTSPGQGRDNRVPDKPPYSLTRDGIIADLSTERPQWILSAYGPGLKAPAQLWGGPMKEQSFEEMRLHYYMGIASGNPAGAAQEADSLVHAAQSQIQNALQNVDGAMQYILKAENEHPNRIDMCNEGIIPNAGGASANPFSSTTSPNNITNNPLGTPQQPAAPFGQPSSLGQTSNPFTTTGQSASIGGFGTPSALGVEPNPFGKPSQPSNAFGSPSVLGSKPNPFGAPTPSTARAFGTPSSLGAKVNPFGTTSQPAAPSVAQPAINNPFNTTPQPQVTPFATPAPVLTNQSSGVPPNPFGAPSQSINPLGTPSQPAANPFGGPSQPTVSNPFSGSAQTTAVNPFGVKSTESNKAPVNPFAGGSQSTNANPFGNPSQQSQSNPFGNPSQSSNPNPFAKPQAQSAEGTLPGSRGVQQPQTNGSSSGYKPLPPTTNGIEGEKSPYPPNASVRHPHLASYATVQQDGRLSMFRGKGVQYREGVAGTMNRADRTWEKIWFPEGPPAYNADTEVLPGGHYDEETRKAYMHARETGTFEGGMVPLLPPQREWCVWDF